MEEKMNSKQLLQSLVSIRSVFPDEGKIGIFLEKILKEQGFKTKRQYLSPKRFNLFGERGRGRSARLFYGHIDTVPIQGDWKTDPFKLTQAGDSLYGLGVCDMKGGIAAMINAFNNTKTTRKIKVLFGVDEENISEGAWKAVEENKPFFSDVSLVVIGESGSSSRQTGGVNVITLGRRGRSVFSIEIFGKSSHGAQPHRGVNAISEVAIAVYFLNKMKLPKHRLLGNSTLFVRKIEGSSKSLSIPDRAYLEIDRHLVIPETVESVKKELQEYIDGLYKKGKLSRNADRRAIVTVLQRKTPYLNPYVTSQRDRHVKKIIGYIKTTYGKPIINYASSVADENVFAKVLHVPILTIGPRGGNIHGADEWVLGKSLKEVSELYSFILKNC